MTGETYFRVNKKERANLIEKELSKYNDFQIKIVKEEIVIKYLPYDLEFVYIPSGTFYKGLSDIEYNQAKKICPEKLFEVSEMRPLTKTSVSEFLVTRTPVLNYFINKYINISYYPSEDLYAAYVTKDVADALCDKLSLRLPNEDEWEYLVRAGSKNLFTFGSDLPYDLELERWLSFEFSDLSINNCNNFGVYGLYIGDWCSNKYQKTYDLNEDKSKCFTIRGGGAYFWPWQDNEWIWCMSAMRMPSSDLIDNECGLRLIYDLKH